MKRTLRRSAAAVLALSVAMTASSCSILEQLQETAPHEDDTAVDDVLAVADEYAKAIEYRDTEKLKVFSTGVTDEDLAFFDLSEEDETSAEIKEFIADSIVDRRAREYRSKGDQADARARAERRRRMARNELFRRKGRRLRILR